jgi:phosphoribosylamine--glycine ligase
VKVLVVGSGGREHALVWKLAQSAKVREIVAAPGNAGMSGLARAVPSDLAPEALLRLARKEGPDLVVIGPEAPLVAGAADRLEREGFRVFGPGREAARLEGSKAYAKEFMLRHGIPTARHASFTLLEKALEYLRRQRTPLVVKDSALAAGKGVTVAASPSEAEEAVGRVLAGGVGEVVIEEFLEGQELSYLVFTDGLDYVPMPLAQDYKQAQDGDSGPMTGGMGAVAPAPLLGPMERAVVEREVVGRTLSGLREDGVEYRGVLYFGLMLTPAGPRLLEYNVRLGDPETQAVLPLLAGDLVDVIDAVIERRLGAIEPAWHDLHSACVVIAAPGYPGRYATGIPLEVSRQEEGGGLLVFHAGTSEGPSGLVSSGGRVLNVTAVADSLEQAVRLAYRGVAGVEFEGAHYRRDIGSRITPRG